MASRVWYEGLRLVTNQLKRYIERNYLHLQTTLEPGAFTCVVALLDAAIECLANLPPRNIST